MNKDVRDKALQIAGNKIRVIFILIWVSLVLYIAPVNIAASIDMNILFPIAMGFCIIFGITFFVLLIYYFTKMSPLKKSLKTLYRTNKLSYADEIISGNYNSDGKIGVSEHLLYDKKTNMIVAFDDIIWIYKKKRDWFTFDVMFCTIDGKQYLSRIDDTTLNEFVKRRAGILLGFTPQNRVVYNAKVKEFKAKNDQ